MGTIKLPFYARLALTLLAFVLILFLLDRGRNIFIPLIFALLIAILLYPLNRLLEKRLRLGRAAAALISVGSFMAALSGFVYFLAVQVISFSEDLPELKKRFTDMFSGLQHWLSFRFHITTRQQTDYINHSLSKVAETAAYMLSNVFVSVGSLLLLLVFIFIFTFFMLYHRRLLMKFVLHLFNPRHREKVHEVIVETKAMINAYVTGLLIEMLLLTILISVILLIMGIKYAILLGVMAAVLNIIPYLGFYTALVLSVLVTFANSSGNTALEVGAIMFGVHLLDSNVLFPRIIGGRVKMNPFITIIAVIIGEHLWGVPGMFLFIPIAGIIKLICERVDGLEAWALLIGVEEAERPAKKKIRIEE